MGRPFIKDGSIVHGCFVCSPGIELPDMRAGCERCGAATAWRLADIRAAQGGGAGRLSA
ncbi:MAG: hypothetical protein WBN94_02425 [Methanothrix sp.]